jgi:flagellar basal-body rod protein FlgG
VDDPLTTQRLYTRAGNFSLNSNGQLTLGSAHNGRLVIPDVTIPTDVTKIQINADGRVFVAQAGNTTLQEAGQIELVTFINPEGLLRLGENLFQETDASGAPLPGIPGMDDRGQLKQGFLEMSNVQPVVELIDMITSQRAYELNSKVTQTGDQILQTVINIRR